MEHVLIQPAQPISTKEPETLVKVIEVKCDSRANGEKAYGIAL